MTPNYLFFLFTALISILFGMLLSWGIAPLGYFITKKPLETRLSVYVGLPIITTLLAFLGIPLLIGDSGGEYGPGAGIGGLFFLFGAFSCGILATILIFLSGWSIWHMSIPAILIASFAWNFFAKDLRWIRDALWRAGGFKALPDPPGPAPPDMSFEVGDQFLSALIFGAVCLLTVTISCHRSLWSK